MSALRPQARSNSSIRPDFASGELMVHPQAQMSIPRDIVTRIVLCLSSRYRFADLMRLTAANRSVSESFTEWRNDVVNGFRRTEPILAPLSEVRHGLIEDMAKAFKDWENTPDTVASPAWPIASSGRPDGIPAPERILAWAKLCAAQTDLLKSKSIKQVDLVLIGLRLSIGLDVTSAMAQFDRLPHLKLVYYLRHRKSQEFQHVDCLPAGDFANFAPALACALEHLPEKPGAQAAQWMLRLVESRGVKISAIRAGYFQLMNCVLRNLHKLDSGQAQAKVLNRWIDQFPEWALPRLHLLLRKLVSEDSETAVIVQTSPHWKWQNKYVQLQALLAHLLVSACGWEAGKRAQFLSVVTARLALPPDYTLGLDGIKSDHPAFKQHQSKLEVWRDRRVASDAARNAGFSVSGDGSDLEHEDREGGNCTVC